MPLDLIAVHQLAHAEAQHAKACGIAPERSASVDDVRHLLTVIDSLQALAHELARQRDSFKAAADERGQVIAELMKGGL